jgi:hypothetical protein
MNFNCYQGKLTCFRGKYQVIRANRTDNKWLSVRKNQFLWPSRKLKRKIGPKKFISPIFLIEKAAFTKNRDIIHLSKAGKSETYFLCMLADLVITIPLEQTA